MLTCQRILAPTDFSDAGNRAVQTAAEIAEHFGADLHLLHIFSPHMFYVEIPEAVLPTFEDFAAEMRAANERKLQELVQNLNLGKKVHVHVLESPENPATAICEAAAELSADLIVIGSHGHRGVMHLLHGATTEHVVRETACPVLVIKPASSKEKE